MVVLSVSICTRNGKALVSRQFNEMTRMRVEGLFAAFPKLVEHAKQHTFVETDTVRYVYQPLENQMYLLLITTKASNIVEDLSTLRLVAKLVPDVAGNVTESSVNEKAFELIFAFDEVITAGGYSDEVTLSSIRNNLQMDSHEEKMHNMIEEQKRKAAEERAREAERKFTEEKVKAMRDNVFGNGTGGNGMSGMGGRMEGFGGGGMGGNTGGMGDMYQQNFGSGAYGNAAGGGFDSNPYAAYQAAQSSAVPVPAAPSVPVKGMKLGGGGGVSKKDSLMAAFAKEDNLKLSSKKNSSAFGGLTDVVSAPAAPPSAPVSLVMEEKLTVTLNRDGGVENCEVKGMLTLVANTDQGSQVSVAINKAALLSQCSSNWNLSTHPKVNKSVYEKEGNLCLKDKKKGFPVGRGVGLFRWAYSADDAAPITLNCWPEEEGDGSITVNMEFELARPGATLHDVNIVVPLGTTDPPVIESIDGVYKHDPRAGMLCWHHDVVDDNNSSGSLEFSIGGQNTEAFFPASITFSSTSLLCPIEVVGVTSLDTGAPVPNTCSKKITPETYQCI